MTLNDLEWRNGRVVCVISPNSVAFGAVYAKVVELDTSPIHSASEIWPKESSFSGISLMAIFEGDHPPARALKCSVATISSQNFAYNQP